MIDYTDRVAIVTGATSGLGRAVAGQMAGAGARGVVIVGRDHDRGAAVAAELSATGADAVFVAADLAEAAAAERIVSACVDRFGRVDVLVNAAALTTRNTILEENTGHFDAVFAVNVRAPFFLMQKTALHMVESGGGAIVNVGSVAGYVGTPVLAAYSASKAALATVTKNAAHSLAEHHIRVNQVNPGWMDTPHEDEIQRRFHGATDGWQERAGAALPFGRLLDPQEVAGMIVYLASPQAGIITGAVVDFDQRVVGGLR